MKKVFIILIISLLMVDMCVAQQETVTGTLNIVGPYTNLFSDYLNASKTQLRLSGKANIRLTGVLNHNNQPLLTLPVNPEYYKSKGGIWNIRLNGNDQPITETDLKQSFSPDVTINNNTQELRVDAFGQYILPEGDYELCITIYGANEDGSANDNSYRKLSAPICFSFTISNIEAPFLQQPQNKEPIPNASATYQPLQFSWTSTAGVLPNRIKYNLQIAELLPNQNEYDAFRSGPLFADIQIENGSPTYLYKASDPKFEVGKSYAWRVVVAEKEPISKYYAFQNHGLSEAFVFQYGGAAADAKVFNITAQFPKNGSSIPWRGIPIIVKYSPYSTDYATFKSYLAVTDGADKVLLTKERSLDWSGAKSPQEAQQANVGSTKTLSEVDAQEIAVNEATNPLNDYEKYRQIKWDAAVTMTLKGEKTVLKASQSASFTAGMGQPVLSLPSSDAKIAKTGEVSFQFLTSQRPPDSELIPDDIVQAKNGSVKGFKISVNEKYVLEIANTKDFKPADLKATQTGKLTINSVDIQNATQLADLTYANISHKITIPSEGTYYWRVKWLTDPAADEKSAHYAVSEIRSFCVGKCGLPPPPDPVVMAECSGCKFPDIQDKVEEKASLAESKIIFAGGTKGYKVTINKISDANSGKGEGIATIFGLPMQVTFEGVKVNKDGVMFAGKIMSKKNSSGIPSLMPDATLPNKLPDFDKLTTTNGLTPNLADPTQLQAQAQQVQTELKNRWTRVTDYINQNASILNNAANTAGCQTPMGFTQNPGGVDITTAFENFLITPTNAQFDVMTVVELKEENIVIPFGFKGACIGIEGSCQEYTLYLYKDVPISNLTLKGGADLSKATHVVYNTKDGFKQINIYAEYEFKKDIIRRKDNNEKVIATLKAQTPNGFSDWVAKVSIPAFKVHGMEDLDFELVGEATYDHSDKENPAGMDKMLAALEPKLPNNDKGDVGLLKENTWKGFYLPQLKVTLPEVFKADQKDRVNVTVDNFVIDSRGVTGSLVAKNAIGIGDGNLAGWYFSLDNFNVTFFNNVFIEAAADGKIVLPISGEDKSTPLTYTTTLTKDKEDSKLKYQFVIKPDNDINASIWKAKMSLLATSNITVTVGDKNVNDGKFLAKADLNGSLTFNTPEIGGLLPSYDLKLMSFEHFKIQSMAPYIDFGNIQSDVYKKGSDIYQKASNFIGALASPQHEVSGLPVNIDEFVPIIKQRGDATVAGFYLHGSLNLSKDLPLSPSAGLGIAILANVKLDGLRPKFSFEGTELEDVKVKGQLGPVSVDGSLKFFRSDKTFGDGFSGSVTATFPMNIAVTAKAQFGGVNNTNYWYVYASGKLPVPIPIGPPFLNITGFGGGAYHNMASTYKPDLNKLPDANAPAYTPSANSNGCLATVYLSLAEESLLKAQTTLNVEWDGDGIKSVGLDGTVDAFNKDSNPATQGVAHGTLKVKYDFRESIFDLKGGLEAKLAGDLVVIEAQNALRIYIDKNTQFMQLGNPEVYEQRVKMTVLKFISGGSYFWLGNGAIPNVPLPQGIDPATLQRMGYKSFKELGFTAAKGGMMFGAYVGFPAPPKTEEELRFLIFYMKLHAGMGFDVQLAKYTEPCGDNGVPGMDGWYALGQLYASAGFTFGVTVDVWFYEGDIEVASVSATAIMQGGLPKPFWFKGMLNGRYSVLDGLVEGDMNFKVSVGNVCIPNPPPTDPFSVPLISEIYPKDGTIDILDNPSAVFNYPVGKEIVITSSILKPGGNGEDKITRTETFKIEITMSMNRTSGDNSGECANNQDDTGELRISNDGLRATYYRNAAFVPNSKYQLQVIAKPLTLENGSWKIMKDKNGNNRTQPEVADFNTGPCPTKLRSETLALTYPYEGQWFVLQKEFGGEGVIAFNKKMCCFGNDCGTGKAYTLVMKFATEDNPANELESIVTSTYGNADQAQTLTFKLPNLPNGKFVRMRLVKKPNQDYFKAMNKSKFVYQSQGTSNSLGKNTVKMDAFVKETKPDYAAFSQYNNYVGVGMDKTTQINSANGVNMAVTRNDKQELVVEPKEVQVAEESYFRTSKYNTMAQKLAMVDTQAKGKEGYFTAYFKAVEGFDLFDVGGEMILLKGEEKYRQPLLTFEFAPQRSNWYQNDINYFYKANERFQFWGGKSIYLDDANKSVLTERLPQVQVSKVFPFSRKDVPASLLFYKSTPISSALLKENPPKTNH
ncbi:hypothetical protein [Runella sp. SP2]|uniref:hypothetical protein n=1 Tax=Runella sp. SP2 TaxID=2268026 RepID=UPI000F0925A6|nr:hypothetical protein [Runella sp. SP2]AYQ30691.1 hypothetical protein DTQ70_00175 [Runella sp. SP2]